MCLFTKEKKFRKLIYLLFLATMGGTPLFLFSCNSKKEAIEAKNGVIDVSNWDFEANGILALKGEWAFYWHKYLKNSDFLQENAGVFVEVPSGWEAYKDDKGEFLPVEGYATYHLLVKIPKQYVNTEVLGLRTQFITTSHALFVQNKLMNQPKRLGTSAQTTDAEYNPDIYFFLPQSDTVEIVLHVANYAYRSGGLTQSISLGKAHQISEAYERTLAIIFLFIGVLLIMGSSHLMMYFFRRRSPSMLYFSLYCFIMALRSLVGDDYAFSDMFPNAHFEVGNMIAYLTFYLGVPVLVTFLHALYPQDFSLFLKRVVWAISIVFSIIVIFTKSFFYSQLLIYYQLFILLLILYTIYFIVRILVRRREGSFILAFGIVTIFFTAVNDILVANVVIDNMNLMPLGSFVFIFSQTLILSKKFATAFRQIEGFTEELQKNNERLAATVNERTTALQQTNTQLSKNLEDLKANTTLFNQQKAQIQDQYKSIKSSITYAKNIQSNIFTDLETIYQRFPDSFVLFKPKDIISGDVYYFKEVRGKVILAAIDCTESGVAGAFMSVISHKLLNDIIESRHIIEPAQILDLLHIGIRKLLRQEESNAGNGMDISLVVIDEKKRELKFAGAKTPLVYVTNGTMGMISGTNAHIGGLITKEITPFSQTTVTLPTKGDFSFYLFTDGYQDQFGGEENKKMMKKNFLGLLHQIYRLPMQEQHKLLIEWYEAWKGDTKQTDDILVMGVRL